MCKINAYLPKAKLAVVEKKISPNICVVLIGIGRRECWLDLTEYTALLHQDAAVLHRHVGQERHHKRESTADFPQTLGQSNDAFHIVAGASQERHVGILRSSGCCLDNLWIHFLEDRFWTQFVDLFIIMKCDKI